MRQSNKVKSPITRIKRYLLQFCLCVYFSSAYYSILSKIIKYFFKNKTPLLDSVWLWSFLRRFVNLAVFGGTDASQFTISVFWIIVNWLSSFSKITFLKNGGIFEPHFVWIEFSCIEKYHRWKKSKIRLYCFSVEHSQDEK